MVAETVRLEVVAGRAEGMSIMVEDELVIGRQAEGAGRLADDDEISRSHARVTLDGSGFCAIEDLGSTNGTFVNGLRISAPQTLFEGDTIELGGTTLVVHGLQQALGKDASPPTSQPSGPPLVSEIAQSPAAEPLAPPLAPSGVPSVADEPPAAEPDATIVPGAIAQPAAETEVDRASGLDVATSPLAESDVAGAPQSDAVQTSIQLTVDFGSRKIAITFADEDRPLRLVYDGRRWQTDTSAG
jgi:predicted component of type VI protein secretion system